MKGFLVAPPSFVLGLILLLTVNAAAQKHAPDDGWRRWNRLYDIKTEQRVTGEVLAVERNPDTRDRAYGIQLRLKTDGGEVILHLGPAWFVQNQDFRFAVGDMVEAVGSFVEFKGTRIMVARELTMDGKVLKLRDRKGFPYWAFKLDP